MGIARKQNIYCSKETFSQKCSHRLMVTTPFSLRLISVRVPLTMSFRKLRRSLLVQFKIYLEQVIQELSSIDKQPGVLHNKRRKLMQSLPGIAFCVSQQSS
eukprot:3169469-Amphidinium_carterae.1